VTFDNVAKSFGSRRLFAGVSFALDARDHAVLVGRNGSGKTTLLRVTAGTEHADEGRVSRARGRRIWLHEQTPELHHDTSLREYLLEAFGEATRLEARLRAAEQELGRLPEGSRELEAALRDYQDLQHRFELAGGYGYQAALETVIEGLGLPAGFLDRRLLSLSGGARPPAPLARGLLAAPDLLLLDEPTNHLDIDSVEWLEDYLLAYRGAFVLVTHDRRLLERVGSRVLALEHGQVATIGADFATYVREREAAGDLLAREYEQAQEKIAQLQRFYDRFHAKKNKAKQAKAKLTQMERLKRDLKPPPRRARTLRLGLPQPQPSARLVLEMKAPRLAVGGAGETLAADTTHDAARDGVPILGSTDRRSAPGGSAPRPGEIGPSSTGRPSSTGDGVGRVLVHGIDLVVERGEKVALLGPNGSGKTTLVETIAGLRTLADGVVHVGHNVRVAYFSQQGRELDEESTVLQSVLPLTGHDEQAARGLLGRFLFSGDDAGKLVAQLSGGERSRLRLLTLLTGAANFLLLDEPTNHLDVESVEALAAGLVEYTGTIVIVTHDRHLIDAVASRVLEIHDVRLVNHLSPERYWEARTARKEEAAAEGAAVAMPSASHGEARGGAPAGSASQTVKKERARTAEEERRRRARVRGLEADILRTEKQLGELDAELAEPGTYNDRAYAAHLAEERAETERRLEELYDDWERALEQR
jgi:ATP-binding cassette subfamily F protein 3